MKNQKKDISAKRGYIITPSRLSKYTVIFGQIRTSILVISVISCNKVSIL